MTRTPYEGFLAGERTDDILIYLSEQAVGNPDALGAVAEDVDGGIVLVLPGEQGRSTFADVTGVDPMDFAGVAMKTDGHVDRDCTGASCPSSETGSHDLKFVFAFAEEQNEAVGGLYAEGDVIHAYASCSCGETYSDKWVVGGEDER